jgi:hypothetical protein
MIAGRPVKTLHGMMLNMPNTKEVTAKPELALPAGGGE